MWHTEEENRLWSSLANKTLQNLDMLMDEKNVNITVACTIGSAVHTHTHTHTKHTNTHTKHTH